MSLVDSDLPLTEVAIVHPESVTRAKLAKRIDRKRRRFNPYDTQTRFWGPVPNPMRYLTSDDTLAIIPDGARSSYSHRWICEDNGEMTSLKNPTSPALMTLIDLCPCRFIDTCTFELVEFRKCSIIPPYAILSHRWNPTEELTCEEFLHPQEETFYKSGYHKIRAACQKARLDDDIRYIWIDTCCIKRGEHTDVKTNITSMYGYYQNAEVCYAYLVDIPQPAKQFETSEWFERGWTLQELLAPKTVIFFDKYWQRIGDKHELQDSIHRRTSIPLQVLCGEQSIHDINVLIRVSWAIERETTRPQDQAYCLQGLLGASIVPNYNECKWTAFQRLGEALLDTPKLDVQEGLEILWLMLKSRFLAARERFFNVCFYRLDVER
ncbi:hypothetical protein VKT23_001273 [Stygiomarasmius scandens]|uniref:Heterokaryon incompatibility domain-containing protein n=1 Tax=Marasmiellus scandens TaxID=2682957 RepID=A0ABR1K6Y4_9AGAR